MESWQKNQSTAWLKEYLTQKILSRRLYTVHMSLAVFERPFGYNK